MHDKLIALLQYAQNGGTFPNEVTREHYKDVCLNQNTGKYEDWYVGAIGFLASYNGRYFDGGYAKTVVTKNGITRNYYDEAKRNLESQAIKLKGIYFINCDYKMFSEVKGTLIYCDIPYKDTTQFSINKNFNYDSFWEWARNMSKNNIVVVSELQAPNDFECIWQQEVTRTNNNKKRFKSEEKLFVFKGSECLVEKFR